MVSRKAGLIKTEAWTPQVDLLISNKVELPMSSRYAQIRLIPALVLKG
jgi:hypothetical protein